MKLSKTRLKQIIAEEMDNLRRNPNGGTSLSEAQTPTILAAIQLQNEAKGAAMALLDASKEFAQMPSHEPASSVASFVEKKANLIVDVMVEQERHLTSYHDYQNDLAEGSDPVGPIAEDLSRDAGKAYGLVDASLSQAERWADELVGIEEYIQDQDVREVAAQATMELTATLEELSGAVQKLIGAVDAELGAGDESEAPLRHAGVDGAKSVKEYGHHRRMSGGGQPQRGQAPAVNPPRKLGYGEQCPQGYKLGMTDYCERVGASPLDVEAAISDIERGR